MNIMELSTLPEETIKEMKKKDLVTAILNDKFYPSYYKGQVDTLNGKIKGLENEKQSLYILLASFADVDLPKDQYDTDKVDLTKVSGVELASKAIAKVYSNNKGEK